MFSHLLYDHNQAPTGSGKTLAYVLPVLEVLSRYIVRPMLYCLVVVPSKDLAVQVFKVFEMYATGTDVKVGVASGLKTFAKEQEKLVAKDGSSKVRVIPKQSFLLLSMFLLVILV